MRRCFIEGERVHLRPLEFSDISNGYLNWFDDEDVCRFNSHHRFPYFEKSFEQYIEKVNSDKNQLVLAIVTNDDNKHIGNISIQNIDYISNTGEYAVIIGERDYWGEGFAYEASVLIIQHAFTQLNLNRIYLGTAEENMGMQNLARKLGFVLEGRQREHIFKNGRYNDMLLYGLLKQSIHKTVQGGKCEIL